MLKHLIAGLAVLWTFGGQGFAQCNGSTDLCNRRYDEVIYATTHNAYSYDGTFLFPNQTHPVSKQLDDGVRGLMLDVYMLGGVPVVYHGSSLLGAEPFIDLLVDIKDFLDQNPNEVVTIILECYITSAQVEAAFASASLMSYLHAQPAQDPWPTLQDMINSGKRLVLFSDVNDAQNQPWYHYVWDYAVETHFSNHARTDFSCAYNRGNPANDLFILNHFVTQQTLGYGIKDSAAAVNAIPYITDRANLCWSTTGKIPNFLTVDFYETGDVFQAVDQLNASMVAQPEADGAMAIAQIAPNPNDGTFFVQMSRALPAPVILTVIDLTGRPLHSSVHPASARRLEVQLDAPFIPAGVYLVHLRSGDLSTRQKIIVSE